MPLGDSSAVPSLGRLFSKWLDFFGTRPEVVGCENDGLTVLRVLPKTFVESLKGSPVKADDFDFLRAQIPHSAGAAIEGESNFRLLLF